MVSFVLMVVAVLGTVGFAIHSLWARQRFGERFGKLELDEELPDLTRFFLETPALLHVSGFVLFISLLFVKELAIERKGVTIALNVMAILTVGALFAAWWVVVPHTLEILGRAP